MQWAVTAAFYCAVHCMSAHLARRGFQVRNHYERDTELADPANGVPQNVYEAYRALKRRSEGARYWMRRYPPHRVRTEILDNLLSTIATFVGLT